MGREGVAEWLLDIGFNFLGGKGQSALYLSSPLLIGLCRLPAYLSTQATANICATFLCFFSSLNRV
jgi:hypothetical protein